MFRLGRYLALGLIAGLCAVRAADALGPAKAPEIVLHKDMAWTGTFARETVMKNAANRIQRKVRDVDVDKFTLRITEVEGAVISGVFSYHHEDRPRAVKFKGALGENGQFQFPITEIVKGSQGAGILDCALVGSFGPNAETIGGAFVSRSRSHRVGEFKGELEKEHPKKGKKRSKG